MSVITTFSKLRSASSVTLRIKLELLRKLRQIVVFLYFVSVFEKSFSSARVQDLLIISNHSLLCFEIFISMFISQYLDKKTKSALGADPGLKFGRGNFSKGQKNNTQLKHNMSKFKLKLELA